MDDGCFRDDMYDCFTHSLNNSHFKFTRKWFTTCPLVHTNALFETYSHAKKNNNKCWFSFIREHIHASSHVHIIARNDYILAHFMQSQCSTYNFISFFSLLSLAKHLSYSSLHTLGTLKHNFVKNGVLLRSECDQVFCCWFVLISMKYHANL